MSGQEFRYTHGTFSVWLDFLNVKRLLSVATGDSDAAVIG